MATIKHTVQWLVLALTLLAWPLQAYSLQVGTDWQPLGELAGPGVAGPFAGTHRGVLIIAGGANFPRPEGGSVFDDGVHKTWHDRIHIARRSEQGLEWLDTDSRLPTARAYGASASHPLGLLAIGGNNGKQAFNDARLLRWQPETQSLDSLELPPLPVPSANGAAAVIGNTLFVAIGHDGEAESDRIFSLDLGNIRTTADGQPLSSNGQVAFNGDWHNAWSELPALPGRRSHMMLVAQDDGRGKRLYLIGGRVRAEPDEHPGAEPVGLGGERFHLHFYSDTWSFAPGSESWTPRADIHSGSNARGQSAGAAIAYGPSHILLLSGADGSQLRRAFGELKVGWKDFPDHPGFRREVLAYNTITDTWASYGSAPTIPDPAGEQDGPVAANAVTTPAVNWDGQIVLPSGEVRPRVRSPLIWSISVTVDSDHFGALNMTVLVIYLLGMVAIGVYFAARNRTTNDYFRGGQQIPWWAAACSMYATMLSSLTYVALPALVFRTDWVVYLGITTILLVAPVAIYVALPFFRQIDATSAYEYLSRRFNMPVRLLASALFTLFHIGRIGIVLALTALALAAVTPLAPWHCVLLMGGMCLIYCTLGGVEAVIWTDTIQTVVLLLGAVLCFAFIINGVDGGFAGFLEAGTAADKFRLANLDFGTGSITSLALWVVVLGGIGQNLSSYTADQAVVQRYMVTKDEKAAARSIWANGLLAVPAAMLFFLIGTGLYTFYRSRPEQLDPNIQIDQIFPSFIASELPVGIAGLIVAGIFAAAQSTVSTSMNSLASTLVTDFMRPFRLLQSERAYLKAARWLTLLVGVLGTLAGLVFISPEIRSLMEEYFKVIGMFMGALGGLFILGVASRRANGWGALIGLFAGVAVMISAWLMQWADGYLFATIGIPTCLLVGYVASLLLPSQQRDLDGLTLYTMHRKPAP